MIKFRMRKFIAAFLIVWMVLLPVRIYAAVPLLALAYTAGGAYLNINLATATSALIGAGVVGASLAYLEFQDDSTGGADSGKSIRAPLTASLAVPAPSAASSASQSMSYSWTTAIGCTAGMSHTGFSSQSASLADYVSTINGISSCTGSGAYVYRVCSTNNMQMQYQTCSGGSCGAFQACYSPINISFPQVTTCPAGYTVSGANCLLADARLAQSDSKKDYARSGTTLSSLNDVDAVGLSLISNPDGSYSLTGSSNGSPVRVSVIPQSSGGSTVRVDSQRLIDNTTVIDTTTLAVDSTGTVSSVSGSTSTGTLSVDGSAPTLGSSVSPSNGASFPSDYVRSGEAAAAAQQTTNAVNSLKDSLTASTEAGDPAAPGAPDMPWFGTTFNGLAGWSLPNYTATCPTSTIDLSGIFGPSGVYVLDAHCQLMVDNAAALQSSMVLVWTVVALFVLLGA